ncbi:MAG: pyridoxamine 5'-phosphate oxidase family protein [Anaerovoracaceae bacterium]
MFRKMRDVGEPLTREESIKMLETQKHGTLAVNGDNGYPYSVPISFVYIDGKIIFHGANTGHKLDSIKKDEKVSFSLIEQDNIIPEDFNTLFRSVIVFGKIKVLKSDEERKSGLMAIIKKYSADFMEDGEKYAEESWDQVAVMELEIEHLTGKKGN